MKQVMNLMRTRIMPWWITLLGLIEILLFFFAIIFARSLSE